MYNASAWPHQCWKSCANGSNIVAPSFGDHGSKEMLGVVVATARNNTQQHATRCSNGRSMYTVTSNSVGSCWPTMLRPFARGFTLVVSIMQRYKYK